VPWLKAVQHSNFKMWYDAGNIIYYTGKDPVEELKPIGFAGPIMIECCKAGATARKDDGERTSQSTVPRKSSGAVMIPRIALCLALAGSSPIAASRYDAHVQAQTDDRPRLSVLPTGDFEVSGTGEHEAWRRVEWTALRRRQPDGHPYESRFKVLYSPTGLYFLMEGTDRTLTATMNEDFMDLWKEDVFEVFLWTDERFPVYFEYEISPLERELPILIPNFGGRFLGWRPWRYERERLTRKATSIIGGPKQSHASIQGWRAEFFIPYALLTPLQDVPPRPGSAWRANFYRMDHDGGKKTEWEWAPVGESFHEYQKFGHLLFADR